VSPIVRRASLPFWGLTAAALFVAALPRLVAHGFFMDGLWYAVIARNQAIGVGSFWQPMFTPTISPGFFADHPPLVFAIESLFFRAFGDHWWVAKLYSAATALATMALIVGLWREAERGLGGTPSLRGLGWLPLLLWVATPLVAWSFSNNMLENTQGLFVLLAALAAYRAAASPRGLAWSVLLGAALYGALLCKGFTGLFPLAFPLILAVTLRRLPMGRAAVQTLVALVVLAGLTALTLQWSEARLFAERYLFGNFLSLVSGSRGGVSNRLHIVGKLLLDLAPALGLLGLIAWGGRSPARGGGEERRRSALAFVLLGLAGSLPLTLSPVQSGFYLVPSFAVFAIGFAILVGPSARLLLGRIAARERWRDGLTAVAALLVVGTLVHAAGSMGTITG
jgi:4-amino-4-deoxy-L-arabinose transferase-like glycosyltransferase